MEIDDILDYVKHTPENTNPNVLRGMLEQLSGGGGGGDDTVEVWTPVFVDGEMAAGQTVLSTSRTIGAIFSYNEYGYPDKFAVTAIRPSDADISIEFDDCGGYRTFTFADDGKTLSWGDGFSGITGETDNTPDYTPLCIVFY